MQRVTSYYRTNRPEEYKELTADGSMQEVAEHRAVAYDQSVQMLLDSGQPISQANEMRPRANVGQGKQMMR